MTRVSEVIILIVALTAGAVAEDGKPRWGYTCQNSKCLKVQLTNDNADVVSLPVCRIFCGSEVGTLWPKPTGEFKVGDKVAHIDLNEVEVKQPQFSGQTELWDKVEERFKEQLSVKVPKKVSLKQGGKRLKIQVNVVEQRTDLTQDTDESYKLVISHKDDGVEAIIDAKTFYGARHAMETLSQVIVFDDIRNEMQIVATLELEDKPKYPHRGLALDTSRNFFSIESIKRTIDAMALVKLNTFHWHITDSQSFPLLVKSRPELAELGAYSQHQIYTPEEIVDVVKYAKVRGVRVLPEFDAPAHIGEGWQNTGLTTCFNYQPWNKYCVEPPCGQFDPSKDELYNYLEDIYREMLTNFQDPDVFHMGGDEVSVACWNTSATLQKWMLEKGWGLAESDFMKLWGYFQENALKRVDSLTKEKKPIILWTSRLTEEPFVDDYLDNSRYIIQIWTKGDDPKIQALLKRGYKLIISNYDALYLDCGFGAWVTEGTNWCSPYIGWEKIYKNDLKKIAGDEDKSLILGAEAALWSEQADEHTLDSRFWPRASALAERLWSDPDTTWRSAEARMLVHRERLVENGIAAESIQPQWCLQHEDNCPITA